MRRTIAGFAFAAALTAGCHHDKHNLAAKYPEEYVLPPNEARFDSPEESGYRRPPAKKDFTPNGGVGGPGSPGGGKGFQGNQQGGGGP